MEKGITDEFKEFRTELVKKNNKGKLKIDAITIIDDEGRTHKIDLGKLVFGDFISKTTINSILANPDVFVVG